MDILVCSKCNKEFKFQCRLLNHLKNNSRCRLTDKEINEYNVNKNNLNFKKNNDRFICYSCNKEYKSLSGIYKHYDDQGICKNIEKVKQNINNDDIIEVLRQSHPEIYQNITQELQPKQPLHQQNINGNHNQIVNGNVNNNINNNNINNNNITNNYTQVIHIHPFGYEDVRKIPKDDMLAILKSGPKMGSRALKAIYDFEEHKNFYKNDTRHSDITFLDKSHQLSVSQYNCFIKNMYRSCFAYIDQMLYICKNDFTMDEIRDILMNIANLKATIITPDVDGNDLNTIIKSEISNNNDDTKINTKKYKNLIKINNNLKFEANQVVTAIDKFKLETYQNKTTPLVSNKYIQERLDIDINNMTQEDIKLDFTINKFPDTNYFRYWSERMENEKILLEETNTSIGDIKKHYRRLERIKKNLEIMEKRHRDFKGVGNIDMKLDTVYSDDGLAIATLEVKKEIESRDKEIDEELELQDNVDLKANLDYDPEQIRRELEEEGELNFDFIVSFN
jgi:hypothetical protein